MTREDAIKELQSYAEHSWGDLNDVFEMAISALRQQEHFREVTKKVEPLTNAQKIRAMSDEELADFLNQWGTSTRAWQKDPGEMLYWLQQPAEENDHDERKENEHV